MKCYDTKFSIVTNGQLGMSHCFIGAEDWDSAVKSVRASILQMLTDNISNSSDEGGLTAAQPVMNLTIISLEQVGSLYHDESSIMKENANLKLQLRAVVDIFKEDKDE